MKNPLSLLFGSGNAREVAKIRPTIEKINSLESELEKLSDEQLKNKTDEFKKRVAGGESLDKLLPEAFAVIREAAKREIGQRHFDVQLVGGVVLHQGKIAEMRTGEGKTLVATAPLYLNALTGKGVHLVTVNDYLAKYQGEWMGRIYDRLGLKTSIIQNQGVSYIFERGYQKKEEDEERAAEVKDINLRSCSRQEAYQADIVYGTNNEFGFDYLRDNMAQDERQLSQRDLYFAIVDEVDSILVDEARTPLIISAAAEESADLYAKFAQVVKKLGKDDYELDEKARSVSLNDQGVNKVERMLNLDNIYKPELVSFVHHLEEALKAEILFKKDRDYVVKDGEIIIVDEFTGRLMPGRRYSEGLHQAIEAKEGVEVKQESETLATISFQNLFRIYEKLSGMTGTAATEAEEFSKIYRLDVVEIPTNKPMIRKDWQDLIYKSEEGKYNAIIEKVKELNKKGQPVLIGTISIVKSEIISKMLKREGIKHEVLNAKNHEGEAKVIAQAGKPFAVTVATNMAGRGVDIILGGNPPKSGEAQKVIEAGGLFVIGTERHESRRIDNQLRGRAGRQGDPGESQFFISMEDDLMRIFGGEKLKNMMNRLGLPDDQPIEHSIISRSIESAQRRVEGHNFDIRKHLVEYDDVMNKQREVIYKKRLQILQLDPNKESFLHKEVLEKFSEEEKKEFLDKNSKIPVTVLQDMEKRVYLSVIDQMWVEHLNTMDQLRDSIGLRGYGQVDPLIAYKQESFQLFRGLLNAVDDQALMILQKMQIELVKPAETQEQQLSTRGNLPQKTESLPAVKESLPEVKNDDVVTSIRSVSNKMSQTLNQSKAHQKDHIGRNDPCPCGSGKKYKKCCGK